MSLPLAPHITGSAVFYFVKEKHVHFKLAVETGSEFLDGATIQEVQ